MAMHKMIGRMHGTTIKREEELTRSCDKIGQLEYWWESEYWWELAATHPRREDQGPR